MHSFGRPIAVLVAACLLTGCLLPTAAKKTGATSGGSEGTIRGTIKGNVKPGVTPVSGSVTPPPAPVSGAGIISNNSGGIISNNAGSLSGIVRAPASLISNNGGGIISNNSGGYRVHRYALLSTVSEKPVAKVQVQLLDAAGVAVKGSDGKALVAETDAEGKYVFKGVLPANNLVVAVVLPDNKGTLKAIAPKGGGDTRKADLNLISTLTTGYIITQYVATQADKQKTLDKLPASVESDTRAKAAQAFSDSNAAVPTALTDANVVQTVTTMRQKSEVFDAQMEDVKKLLIAAGQSDLGAGRPALEVTFSWVDQLLLDGSGALMISCGQDRRLWRIAADGKLVTAAGKGGTASLTSPNGVAGPEASLGRFASVRADSQGRALILEDSLNYEDASFPDAGRLTRLGADGKLTELAAQLPGAIYALPGVGDEVLVISSTYVNEDDELPVVALWSVKPGAAPVKKTTFSETDAAMIDNCDEVASDGQGRLFLVPYAIYDEATETASTDLFKLEPNATAFTKVSAIPDDMETVFDSRGNMFGWNSAADNITVRKADGTTATVLSTVPTEFGGGSLDAALLAPDGTVYLSWGQKVYKVVAGKATAIAGTGQKQETGSATGVAVALTSLAVSKAGDLYFSGENDSAIYKIGADKQVKPFAGGEGASGSGSLTGPALQVDLTFPDSVQTDAAGNVYFYDQGSDPDTGDDFYRICKVDTAGNLTEAFRTTVADDEINELAVAPDGTLYMVMTNQPQPPDDDPDAELPATVKVVRKAAGGAPTTLKTETSDDAAFVLAANADGVYFAGYSATTDGQLYMWTQATGVKTLKADTHFDPTSITMAMDPTGRLYLANSDENKIYRYDLAAATFKLVAGKGAPNLNGTTVDTSIDAPSHPCFDKDGNLLFADTGHRQIKRIPASLL